LYELEIANIVSIGDYAFANIPMEDLTLGTSFEDPTIITLFGSGVFVDENNGSLPYTQNTDLTLGAEVLPLPNITNRT
jgi:hypothetical protein